MPDPNFTGVCDALKWFCFTDTVQHQISRQQNYSVYPYLQYGFVVWHLLFATLAWPKIAFPTRGFEVRSWKRNHGDGDEDADDDEMMAPGHIISFHRSEAASLRQAHDLCRRH